MSKGKRRERDADDIYSEAGFETFRPQESKYGETDMFGLFDVLAIRDGYVRLSQVKANGARGIESWGEDVLQFVSGPQVIADFLVCHDGHGGPHPTPPRWRLYVEHGDGMGQWVVDEREDDIDSDGDGIVEYLSQN